jgi:putative flippase GtrA
VDIVRTVRADIAGIARMLRAFGTGRLPVAELRAQIGRQPLVDPAAPPGTLAQLVRFAVIGVLSTLAYLLLFVLLRDVVAAQPANLVALLVTAVANTAANRRITFGIRGSVGAGRAQLQGLVVFALGLALTSGSLALLGGLAPGASRTTELALLLAANAAATLLRFVLFRGWVFRRRPAVVPAGDVVVPEMEAAR